MSLCCITDANTLRVYQWYFFLSTQTQHEFSSDRGTAPYERDCTGVSISQQRAVYDVVGPPFDVSFARVRTAAGGCRRAPTSENPCG